MALTSKSGTTYGYDGIASADCSTIDGTNWYQPAGGQKTSQAAKFTRM